MQICDILTAIAVVVAKASYCQADCHKKAAKQTSY